MDPYYVKNKIFSQSEFRRNLYKLVEHITYFKIYRVCIKTHNLLETEINTSLRERFSDS
jgi:hypothetical protein